MMIMTINATLLKTQLFVLALSRDKVIGEENETPDFAQSSYGKNLAYITYPQHVLVHRISKKEDIDENIVSVIANLKEDK